jgi:hypothetical protein
MKMIDALHPNNIPQGTTCDIAAAYIDHTSNPDSFSQMVAKFPKAIHLKISVQGTVGAHILDYERSTTIGHQAPSACVTWAVASRKAGIDPTIYCNQLDSEKGWPAIRAAFNNARVPQPHYWVANYDGNPAIPAGAIAKQYTDLDPHGINTYDTSSTVSNWPTTLEDDVSAAEVIGALKKGGVLTDVGTLRDRTINPQYKNLHDMIASSHAQQMTAIATAGNPTRLAAALLPPLLAAINQSDIPVTQEMLAGALVDALRQLAAPTPLVADVVEDSPPE